MLQGSPVPPKVPGACTLPWQSGSVAGTGASRQALWAELHLHSLTQCSCPAVGLFVQPQAERAALDEDMAMSTNEESNHRPCKVRVS